MAASPTKSKTIHELITKERSHANESTIIHEVGRRSSLSGSHELYADVYTFKAGQTEYYTLHGR